MATDSVVASVIAAFTALLIAVIYACLKRTRNCESCRPSCHANAQSCSIGCEMDDEKEDRLVAELRESMEREKDHEIAIALTDAEKVADDMKRNQQEIVAQMESDAQKHRKDIAHFEARKALLIASLATQQATIDALRQENATLRSSGSITHPSVSSNALLRVNENNRTLLMLHDLLNDTNDTGVTHSSDDSDSKHDEISRNRMNHEELRLSIEDRFLRRGRQRRRAHHRLREQQQKAHSVSTPSSPSATESTPDQYDWEPATA